MEMAGARLLVHRKIRARYCRTLFLLLHKIIKDEGVAQSGKIASMGHPR